MPADRVEYVPWSPESEASVIQSFDVGIMPLDDSPWARGKCSYKMLLYMACGIPVVVSPVGMNAEVLALGSCGLGATSESVWNESLAHLLEDRHARLSYGHRGREIVLNEFSITTVAPRLASVLRRWTPQA